MDISVRQQAQELLARTETISLPTGIWAWSWQPFATPSDEEELDGKRRHLLRAIRDLEDPERRIAAAGALISSSLEKHVYTLFLPVCGSNCGYGGVRA